MTFRDVFAVGEFRALWLAQLLSVAGDQLARVALTALVYDRTRSAFLAAVTFVASVVPVFIGGVTLAGLADRYPRRRVMIACDVARCALVLVMAVPGMPLAAGVALLFAVTLVGAPFTSARAATYPDVLTGDEYVMGTAVTLMTNQFAQVIGFAAGGAAVGFFGARTSLVVDAATFAASAVIVRARVRARPAPMAAADGRAAPGEGFGKAVWLVFANPALLLPMLFGWLAAFYNAPEGVVAPLAGSLGGGSAAIGVILAAQAFGETAGTIAFSRFVSPDTRLRLMGPLAVATCGVLVLFALRPGLYPSLLLLAVSGACAAYQLAANAAFVRAAPQWQRSQAFGVAQGGMSLGQGTVMLVAGAAAERITPALVIAACGGAGAIMALAVAARWARGRGRLEGHLLAAGHGKRCRAAWGGFSPSSRRAWRAPLGWWGGVVVRVQPQLSPRMACSSRVVGRGGGAGSAPALAAHGMLLSGGGAGWWCGFSPSSRRAWRAPFSFCVPRLRRDVTCRVGRLVLCGQYSMPEIFRLWRDRAQRFHTFRAVCPAAAGGWPPWRVAPLNAADLLRSMIAFIQ